MRQSFAALILFTALAGCAQPAPEKADEGTASQASAAQSAALQAPPSDAPAGRYEMDPAHTSVIFRIPHMGLSHYTARFTKVSGALDFDPDQPAAQAITAVIDAGSLETSYPDAAKLDFNTQIEKDFLDAPDHPEITFRSTKVEPTGPATAKVTGELTLKGVTKPVTLDVTWNGGHKPMEMDPGGRVGFSARGVFKRSDFGITYGLPAPGTNMGVGDEIEVLIETEFTRPTATN